MEPSDRSTIPSPTQGATVATFSEFWQVLRRKILLWAVPSIILTAIYLHDSEYGGRLAITPSYDDVTYCIDGLKRLILWEDGGFDAFRQLWFSEQPHSPGSTLQALIGFALFGPQFWAPYAMNVVFVLLAFLLFDFLTSGLAWWKKGILLVFLISPSFMTNLVVEFRPDLPSTLLLCCGIFLLIHRDFFWQPRWYQAMAGAFLGLSLWIKPTAFAALIGTVIGLFGLVFLLELALRFKQTSVKRIFLGLLFGFGAFAIIGMPYVLANIEAYIAYMKFAFYGPEKPIENFQGPFWDNVRYYWDGPSAQYMVGGKLVSCCFLLFGGSLIFLLIRGPRPLALKYLAYFFVLAVLFAGPSMMPVKTPFFGANFEVLVLFLAIAALAGCCRRLPFFGPIIAVLFAGYIFIYSSKNLPFIHPSPRYNYVKNVSDDLVQVLPGFFKPTGRTSILITAIGWINNDSLEFAFLQKGFARVDVGTLLMKSTIDAYPTTLGTTDLVIASEPGNPDPLAAFPCSFVQEETLAQIRAREEFSPIGHVLLHNGKGYCLFGKRSPFFGMIWDDDSFPAANLPDLPSPAYIGKNEGNTVLLAYPTPQDFHLNLDLKLMSKVAGQKVHVSLNGSEIGVCELAAAGQWADYTFDLPPALVLQGISRNSINFTYELAGSDATPDSTPPVYYQEIQIRPLSAGLRGANRGGLAACRSALIAAQ